MQLILWRRPNLGSYGLCGATNKRSTSRSNSGERRGGYARLKSAVTDRPFTGSGSAGWWGRASPDIDALAEQAAHQGCAGRRGSQADTGTRADGALWVAAAALALRHRAASPSRAGPGRCRAQLTFGRTSKPSPESWSFSFAYSLVLLQKVPAGCYSCWSRHGVSGHIWSPGRADGKPRKDRFGVGPGNVVNARASVLRCGIAGRALVPAGGRR